MNPCTALGIHAQVVQKNQRRENLTVLEESMGTAIIFMSFRVTRIVIVS